jgi:hypothetical protein
MQFHRALNFQAPPVPLVTCLAVAFHHNNMFFHKHSSRFGSSTNKSFAPRLSYSPLHRSGFLLSLILDDEDRLHIKHNTQQCWVLLYCLIIVDGGSIKQHGIYCSKTQFAV